MDAALPARVKRQIAALQPQLYVVDARAVADSVGLGKRINMVMQTVFFQLSGVVPLSKVRGASNTASSWCYTPQPASAPPAGM